ncbi:NAD(P)/FAD-dependent oxidoreductase [Verticiella sediminum]|uniref:NAD(P)/FAD-dependent oxidoreductase n=1 Tax=Verticiella sediminum TaxID=1247510 RepID=A0A556A876_9BURK|nr:NAD(P)/FAD-dependent oxidoreductase [Verticiella sediminum]TSH89080.1 NAD(P)/FAD-dependent oxidoreductase [Verticiella sediminum]
MSSFDVAVIGAGAAGMMCAAVAGQRGLRVVLIDHASRLAEKIRISGGGRCNFTNRDAGPAAFLSANPAFCRSALARYTPQDFLRLLAKHRIGWHEKHRGQLFCDDSSEAIIEMLRRECEAGGVAWRMPCAVARVRCEGEAGFVLDTDHGPVRAARVVLATGGMAVPQIGATDFALRVARELGMKIIEPRPALVPLTFDAENWRAYAALAGVAQEVDIATGKGKMAGRFREDLLFTHRGLSGPAVLQISSYWQPGEPIRVDLAAGQDLADALLRAKPGSRQQIDTVLAGLMPRRLAEQWLADAGLAGKRLADLPDKALRGLGLALNEWQLVPSGTAGYKKAEVMRGGIDTRELNQQDMQARRVPGLYAIGEAVDVTGWLGGYNFQWAWASAMACALGL